MNEEKAITVCVEMRLSFEVQEYPNTNRDNSEVASEAAIAGLRAHLARYSQGRVISLERNDKTV